MDLLHALAHDWRISIGITVLGIAFFGALTVDGLVRRKKRGYLSGLFLIDLGLVNSLIRNLSFFDLSPHPARPGGLWRIGSALLVVSGFILFERARRQERVTRRGP